MIASSSAFSVFNILYMLTDAGGMREEDRCVTAGSFQRYRRLVQDLTNLNNTVGDGGAHTRRNSYNTGNSKGFARRAESYQQRA